MFFDLVHLFLRFIADILQFSEKESIINIKKIVTFFRLHSYHKERIFNHCNNALILNQYTWTYLGDSGYSEVVGLYHSSKSGHLMIYVGKKIMVVDFSVRDSKTYSFFINDELCEVQLERKDLEMFYHFKINKDADTPRNKARKKIEKKHIKQALLFFALIILAVILTAFYFNSKVYPTAATAEAIINPAHTIGEIDIKMDKESPVITYYFVANSQNYNAKVNIGVDNKTIFDNNFPINAGDEFIVEYDAFNPKVNRILFDKPSERQLSVYLQKTMERHLELNPDISEKMALCQLKIAYDLNGLSALSDFFYQKLKPADNPKHNQNTYHRLTRGVSFNKKVEQKCW